jgi:hypothetical protein
MEIGNTAGVEVTKTLMPQNTELVTGEMLDEVLGIIRGHEEIGKGRGRHIGGSSRLGRVRWRQAVGTGEGRRPHRDASSMEMMGVQGDIWLIAQTLVP